ncbi:hypothetical protein CDV31_014162 [Fusarium ambrosium]|uniref:Uncharacterized protein n=1 Tax=Fusarium ambrosium TaxID=131363 RepID=A0A428SYF2_9HYPO|nr:hypothetical protein CDV31_014162 [Fusarium ambrosium]
MFNRLFRRRQGPRRNSDDEHNKTQYWTPRGSIPAKIVNQQTQELHHVVPAQNGRFPKEYRNDEDHGPNFHPYERRNNPAQRRLFEVPVNTRMEIGARPAPMARVQNRENLHPNDRARAARNELNDPGPLRGVVAAGPDGTPHGVVGVIYHPEGNLRGYNRAPVEPLDRQGRQQMRRFADDAADARRVGTWPPRDEDADDLATYETRYAQVRRPRNPPQPRR